MANDDVGRAHGRVHEYVTMLARTVGGVVVGLFAAYIPSAFVGALVGVAAQGTSRSGGWVEAGAIGAIAWLAGTGGIVGAIQRSALPRPRRSWWPIPMLALIWGMAHPLHVLIGGRAGAIDLRFLLPLLVLISAGVGVLYLAVQPRREPTVTR